MDLRKLAEGYVNGPDNGTAEVLEALLKKVAAGAKVDAYEDALELIPSQDAGGILASLDFNRSRAEGLA